MCGRKSGICSRKSRRSVRLTASFLLVSLLAVQSLGAWAIAPVNEQKTGGIQTPQVERIVVMPDEAKQEALKVEIGDLKSSVTSLLNQLSQQAQSLRTLQKDSTGDMLKSKELESEITRLEGLLKISQAEYETLKSDYDDLKGKYDVLDRDFGVLAQKYNDKVSEVDALRGELKVEKTKAKVSRDRAIVGAEAIYEDGRYGVGGSLGVRLVGGFGVTGGIEWMIGDPPTELRYRAGLSLSF